MDVVPEDKIQVVNAWAGRMIAFGNIAGYFTGFLDLPLANLTQIRFLCIMAALVLTLCVSVTCFVAGEDVLGSVQSRYSLLLRDFEY
jgi:solute carrier family 45 protein 1/2/4